jgi:hypothetical protein
VQPKAAGTVCRGSADECDLDEYCNGKDALCPANTHVHDGLPCGKHLKEADKVDTMCNCVGNGVVQGYCSSGKCGSHTLQCKHLWGDTSEKSADECFSYNTRAESELSPMGNCGYNRDTQQFLACTQK